MAKSKTLLVSVLFALSLATTVNSIQPSFAASIPSAVASSHHGEWVASKSNIPIIVDETYGIVSYVVKVPRVEDDWDRPVSIDLKIVDSENKVFPLPNCHSDLEDQSRDYQDRENGILTLGFPRNCYIGIDNKNLYSSSLVSLHIEVLEKNIKYDEIFTLDLTKVQKTYFEVLKSSIDSSRNVSLNIVARKYNSSQASGKVEYKICLDVECKAYNSDESGNLKYSGIAPKSITSPVLKISAKINSNTIGNKQSGKDFSDSYNKQLSPPSTYKSVPTKPSKLSATISAPTSAKLGVYFKSKVKLFGKGSARCGISTSPSNNGGESYAWPAWSSPSFQIRGGQTKYVKTLMVVNKKGLWGVFLNCTDNEAKSGFTESSFAKIVQN